MALPDKVEAVKKVSETLNKQSVSNPAEELERASPNKEHFQSLMSSQVNQPSSIERLDKANLASEEIQKVEKNPIFTDENVSAQKSGTATDQEGKRRQQSGEEVGGVEGVAGTGSKKVSSSSLMSDVAKLNKDVANISQLNPEAIKAQAKEMVAQLEQVKTQLSQAQGEIKPSYQTLLRNRLTHIDDHLKIALSKAGIEQTPTTTPIAENANPMQRFINMLTDTQGQMNTLHSTVEKLGNGQTALNPTQLLALQIKVGYIQQEIELFTNLLNKALESTKTLMNVQV